jgi:hypothetical protein
VESFNKIKCAYGEMFQDNLDNVSFGAATLSTENIFFDPRGVSTPLFYNIRNPEDVIEADIELNIIKDLVKRLFSWWCFEVKNKKEKSL